MIIQASSDTYFMLLMKFCNKNEFIAAAGVRPESPGAEFVSRIYCCLFNAVTDISLEYQRYYKIEYKDMWRYLYWHYSIDKDVMEQLRKAYDPPVHLLYGDVNSGGDYGIGQYVMSEEGFPIVGKIIVAATKENLK